MVIFPWVNHFQGVILISEGDLERCHSSLARFTLARVSLTRASLARSQFGAFQFGAFQFGVMPVWRVSLWRVSHFCVYFDPVGLFGARITFCVFVLPVCVVLAASYIY